MSKEQAIFYLVFWLGFAGLSWIGVQLYLRWEDKRNTEEKYKKDCD